SAAFAHPCESGGQVGGTPGNSARVVKFFRHVKTADRDTSVIRMPAYDAVRDDAVLYAHASRILHLESNPGNARALAQRHGDVDVWLNPPPIPLTSPEIGRAC